MKSDLQPEYGPARKVNPVSRRIADISHAKKCIGFESRVTLEDGLSRFVNWWQANRIASPVSV
jgi:UDP-glucose 4-epimerase